MPCYTPDEDEVMLYKANQKVAKLTNLLCDIGKIYEIGGLRFEDRTLGVIEVQNEFISWWNEHKLTDAEKKRRKELRDEYERRVAEASRIIRKEVYGANA